MKNPRTRTLLKLTGGKASIRLLGADRSFLRDLARLGFIDARSASTYHYAHLHGGCERSLARLERAGLIRGKRVRANGEEIKAYEFASREVAKAWGGAIPVVGARRSELHELVTSRLYYALGCPTDFRIEAHFSETDQRLVGLDQKFKPDAMFTDGDGQIVFVEADSGHYSKSQIRKKMTRWRGFKQVWGQPATACARVPAEANVAVVRV